MELTAATLKLRQHSLKYERDVQRFLCPIYGVSGSVGKPVGSGFLLELSSATLLITVAHVIHEMHYCVLHTLGTTHIVPIEGNPHSTGPRTKQQDPDFGLDIGFVVLNEAAMQERPKCARLRPADLDVADRPMDTTAYGFVGIPASENQPVGNIFDGKSYFYGGLPAPRDIYDRLQYRAATHFIMNFEQWAMIDEASQVIEVAEPRGMSGGPIFKLGSFQDIEAGTATPRVIGVATEWYPHRDIFVGIRISMVVDCIRQMLPQFAPELPVPPYVQGIATLR